MEEQRRELGHPASNIQLKLAFDYKPPRGAEAFTATLRRKRASRERVVDVYKIMKKQ